VVDGQVKIGQTIKLMSSGSEFTVVEAGYMGAVELVNSGELNAGEVGYIAASIKSIGETKVGDTVTDAENPCTEPLHGYREVNPMVFSGIYPSDGARYGDLRDALEKLQLNDASLSFEPETSVALGFGFRCGFLGLLIWKLFRKGLSVNTILTLLQQHRRNLKS
jgi:GTP-binding protein LepA